jgi:hypothetical protein
MCKGIKLGCTSLKMAEFCRKMWYGNENYDE